SQKLAAKRSWMMPPTIEQLTDLSLSSDEARALLPRLEAAWRDQSRQAIWQKISQTILTPGHPFALHQFFFAKVYEQWDQGRQGPPPAWLPIPESIHRTNVAHFMATRGFGDYAALHAWSAKNPAGFWESFVSEVGIRFAQSFSQVVDLSAGVQAPRWFV